MTLLPQVFLGCRITNILDYSLSAFLKAYFVSIIVFLTMSIERRSNLVAFSFRRNSIAPYGSASFA